MGSLRIIAGEHRGRRIEVPRTTGVRPTADRVREALFSILGDAVRGARVLDAYAGSGALGLEALSRGALRVTFAESDRRAAATLRANAAALEVTERCEVVEEPVLVAIERGAVRGPFDLVLADPPYEGPERLRLVAFVGRLLAPDGLAVVERDTRSTSAGAPGLDHTRTARYGRASLDFYRVGSSAGGTGSPA